MSSGHSFLPCDREFAPIERLKKSAVVNVPEDWVRVISEAKSSNNVIEMTQQDFLSFDGVKFLFRQPSTLKMTEIMAIRLTQANPEIIYTKIGHDAGTTWDEHVADSRFNVYQNPINIPRKYMNPIPISSEKRRDLLAMSQFLLPQYRQFYLNL